MKSILIYFFLIFILNGNNITDQVKVMILSKNVGTEIDVHENRFYRIFPKEKGLINAQIIRINDSQYRLLIVKKVDGMETKVRRYLTSNEFDKLKKYVNEQPEITEESMIAMYSGMDFLRAENIINEIPKPQYVVLQYSGNKKVNGTLFKVQDNILYVQTPMSIEQISLESLDQMAYRSSVGKFDHIRPYIYAMTGLSGLAMARVYNSQRPDTYNQYGIPRNDLNVYRQIIGFIFGLIFSSEVFDAVSTLLTPKETIILSEAEYERQNY